MDPEGNPVAGARVTIGAPGWTRQATTDAAGRFLFTGVPFHRRYAFDAQADNGYAWGRLGAIYPDVPVTVEVRLHTGPTEGACGSVLAKRTGTAVTYFVPFTPAQYPVFCL